MSGFYYFPFEKGIYNSRYLIRQKAYSVWSMCKYSHWFLYESKFLFYRLYISFVASLWMLLRWKRKQSRRRNQNNEYQNICGISLNEIEPSRNCRPKACVRKKTSYIWGFTLYIRRDAREILTGLGRNSGKEKKMIRINPQNRSFIDQK